MNITAPNIAPPVPLFLSTTPQQGRRWIHIATAGNYAGYQGGTRPFEFTRDTFETVVANFRRNPQYGRGPVVPFDYEHASEKGLQLPGVAEHGVPATGWIYDLDIRTSSGATELWALTEWTPRAAEQIRAGEYRWTSVAIHPNFIDPVSGTSQGPTLTSVALTNKPFLQGLEPIAASQGFQGEQPPVNDHQHAVLRTIDAINGQPGINEIDRANNYLSANAPGHKDLHRSEQMFRAGQFVRDVCQLASQGPVKLSAAPTLDAHTPATREAAASVAQDRSNTPGFDYASRVLAAIERMPGRDEIEKTVKYLDGLETDSASRPFIEKAKVAARFLQGLKEAVVK